jgi:uncharacterized membrane protein YdjX (TVP38/TMEM64 family)
MSEWPSSRKLIVRVIILLSLVSVLGWVYYSGLTQSITFDQLKSELGRLQAEVDANRLLALVVFFAVYVLVTGLSLPFASWLSLLAGALFGRWLGTGIVSLAATSGATLAMLASRYLLRDWLLSRFTSRLAPLQDRFQNEGPYFLFTLRLIPLLPFWMVNLAMGLTPIKTRSYVLVSWLGMLPGTFFYVSLGADIANIESPRGLVTLAVLRWFIVIGLFPWLCRIAIRYWTTSTVKQ